MISYGCPCTQQLNELPTWTLTANPSVASEPMMLRGFETDYIENHKAHGMFYGEDENNETFSETENDASNALIKYEGIIDFEDKDNLIEFMAYNKCSYEETVNKLFDISKLSYNWDGYYSKPIPQNIIYESQKILYRIRTFIVMPDIAPTGRETIQFEYEAKNGSYIEFELYTDKIKMLFEKNNEYIEKEISINNLMKYLEEFFIDARN